MRELLENISRDITNRIKRECNAFDIDPVEKSLTLSVSFRGLGEGEKPSVCMSYRDGPEPLTLPAASHHLKMHGHLFISEGERFEYENISAHELINGDWFPADIHISTGG